LTTSSPRPALPATLAWRSAVTATLAWRSAGYRPTLGVVPSSA